MRLNKSLEVMPVYAPDGSRPFNRKTCFSGWKACCAGMQIKDFQEIKVEWKAIKREEKKVLVFISRRELVCSKSNVKKM